MNVSLRSIRLGNTYTKVKFNMIRNIIFLVCCIAVGESSILSDFQTFKTKFNKTYKDDLEVIKSISLFRVINLLYTITIKVIRLRSL